MPHIAFSFSLDEHIGCFLLFSYYLVNSDVINIYGEDFVWTVLLSMSPEWNC